MYVLCIQGKLYLSTFEFVLRAYATFLLKLPTFSILGTILHQIIPFGTRTVYFSFKLDFNKLHIMNGSQIESIPCSTSGLRKQTREAK